MKEGKEMAGFVHLRLHSKISVGKSTISVGANKKAGILVGIPELCIANNMQACALTDTNMMSGCAELSDVMPSNKLQPIVGIEITLNQHNADPKILRSSSLSRVVLLAQNHKGYLNLCELTRIMYMRQENHHLGPYVTFDELESHSGGIICLSGAHTGPIGQAIISNQEATARSYAEKLAGIYSGRFYIEIQRHGLEDEVKTEPVFLDIAQGLNLPIVATNDVCFATAEDYEAADALECILNQTKVGDPERPRKCSEQYFKTAEEMTELFSDLPEAIENTVKIANRCAFFVNVHEKPLLPRFGDDFDDECKMLRDNTMNGLADRLREQNITDTAPYFEQAEYELDVIINMGFPGYFLIVADYIDWCRKHDILTGPGRGSGAGSIVAWALGITHVNPLKYGLLFERFLNPDRISMPDFDVDFEPTGIERVLEYICNKYGHDSVCRIITFGSLLARGAIKDVGRVYGIPYSKSDKLSKLIPGDWKKSLREAVENIREIQEVLENDSDMKKVVSIAETLEGSIRNLGQHACGVVIGDRPTTKIAPVYRDPANPLPSCQFDGHYLESSGLIKFDFLGLETLVVLKYATKLIQKTRNVNVILDDIPTDDPETLALWQSGMTEGIFQFDAPFVQQTLKKMHPNSFLEISALNALNRPGPIANIPEFIARMHGESPIEYVHPLAEPVLKETYGIIVYQEQVMQLTRVLAGFTRGQSDNVRKAMGKKKLEELAKLEVKFFEGCKEHGTLDEETAKKLWEQFKKFAEYAFNKSHALAYSIVANQCAYLKAHYPAEFLAASMSSNMNDTDQLAIFVDDAKTNFNIPIVPPDINLSESLFDVRDNKIIYGLAAIKGVGVVATDAIIKERKKGKFKNLTDFAKRCAPIINKRILEAFARVGVLDSLHKNRAEIFTNADMILGYASKSKEAQNTLSLFANTVEDDVAEDRLTKQLVKVTPWTFGQVLDNELQALGFYISAHPLDQYRNLIVREKLVTSTDLAKMKDRSVVQIAANKNSYSQRKTKAGKDMLTINASDSAGSIDAIAFGDAVANLAPVLATENEIFIVGRVSNRDDRVSVFVDSVAPLSQWVARVARKLTLDIHNTKVLNDVKNALVGLVPGNTRVVLNLFSGDKKTTMGLPKGVELGKNTVKDFAKLGIKVNIE